MKSKDSEASCTWSIIDTVLLIKRWLATINMSQQIVHSPSQPCKAAMAALKLRRSAHGHHNMATCWRPPAGSVIYAHHLWIKLFPIVYQRGSKSNLRSNKVQTVSTFEDCCWKLGFESIAHFSPEHPVNMLNCEIWCLYCLFAQGSPQEWCSSTKPALLVCLHWWNMSFSKRPVVIRCVEVQLGSI